MALVYLFLGWLIYVLIFGGKIASDSFAVKRANKKAKNDLSAIEEFGRKVYQKEKSDALILDIYKNPDKYVDELRASYSKISPFRGMESGLFIRDSANPFYNRKTIEFILCVNRGFLPSWMFIGGNYTVPQDIYECQVFANKKNSIGNYVCVSINDSNYKYFEDYINDQLSKHGYKDVIIKRTNVRAPLFRWAIRD